MTTTTVQRRARDWTYERYLELDDEQRYEIIDGDLLVTPAPGTFHQRIVRKLGFRISQFVDERDLGEIFLAPTDVVIDETDVIQPDILFVRADRRDIIKERAIHGRPDLAIEILSPSSIRRDRHRKRALYERASVPEFWIVDPANRTVEVFSWTESGYELTAFTAENGSVSSRVLDGFSVEAAEIFA